MRMHKAIILWWLRFPSSSITHLIAFAHKNKSFAGFPPCLSLFSSTFRFPSSHLLINPDFRVGNNKHIKIFSIY